MHLGLTKKKETDMTKKRQSKRISNQSFVGYLQPDFNFQLICYSNKKKPINQIATFKKTIYLKGHFFPMKPLEDIRTRKQDISWCQSVKLSENETDWSHHFLTYIMYVQI